jgi:predicted ester cyclase
VASPARSERKDRQMTTEQLKQLGRRVYEAINAQDLAALEELFDPAIVRHAAGEVGIDRAKQAVTKVFAAFPDTRFEVEDVFAEADRVALRVTVHRGEAAPGTALPTILEIFRVEDGRVAEIWGAGTAGVRPPPAGGGDSPPGGR